MIMDNFEKVFHTYHHRLFLYSMKFIDNESDALDIVQNVFISAWEKKKIFESEEYIKSYLFNSIRNSCFNYLKHQSVIRKYENEIYYRLKSLELSHFSSGEISLIERENIDEINSSIDTLGEIYKEVIILSRFEGLKNNQIAEKLNLPLRTVETRIYRALRLLKEKLSAKSFLVLISIFKTKS